MILKAHFDIISAHHVFLIHLPKNLLRVSASRKTCQYMGVNIEKKQQKSTPVPGSSKYIKCLPKLVGFCWGVNFGTNFTLERKIQACKVSIYRFIPQNSPNQLRDTLKVSQAKKNGGKLKAELGSFLVIEGEKKTPKIKRIFGIDVYKLYKILVLNDICGPNSGSFCGPYILYDIPSSQHLRCKCHIWIKEPPEHWDCKEPSILAVQPGENKTKRQGLKRSHSTATTLW